MSRKTQKKKVATKADAAPAPVPAARFWPETFCSQRTALLIGLCFFLFTLLLFGVASVNGLLWVKRLMGAVIGLEEPGVLPLGTHSWDIAIILWVAALVLSAGLIHPALGLVALLLLRTPLDGYTYKTDNLYFVWGIVLLLGIQAWRSSFRGAPVRIGPLPWLLLAFFLAVLAVSPASINFDHTYRQLIIWFGYLLLLLLVVNAVEDRRIFTWVLAGIAVVLGVQALYSILHFHYMLPFMRQLLMESPEARISFFGTDTLSPALIHRLNVNRAFGTMLFPNALAGFLVLCIPFTVCGTLVLLRALRFAALGQTPHRATQQVRYQAALCGCITWLMTVVAVFSMVQFTVEYSGQLAWYHDPGYLAVLLSVLALLPAGLVTALIIRHGLHHTGCLLAAWLLPAAGVLGFWALWLTYSRAALFALLAAAGAAVMLALLRHGVRGRTAAAATAAALLLTVHAGIALALPRAQAQEQPQQPPAAHEALVPEGFDPTAEALLDPQTFRLRLSYWDVGRIMFQNNWLTGVGLGNFGVAYPRYQYPGAADVKEAHNGFLQTFSETGVLGGLLFAAFWAFFLLWGAWRLWREADSREFMMLLGLYTGLLAFLMHAFVDIHFSHPSLVMFGIVFAGLFWRRAAMPPPAAAPPAPPAPNRGLARPALFYPVLIVAALAAGLGLRPYLHDLGLSRLSFINVGAEHDLRQRLGAAQAFLDDAPTFAEAGGEPPRIMFAQAYSLIPDADRLAAFGNLYALMPATGRWRLLGSTEPIPQDALLEIQRPMEAYAIALEYAAQRVAELERIDAWYGHDPEIAVHISIWCDFITRHSAQPPHSELHSVHLEKMLAWAEEGLRRNPRAADMHAHLGQMRWNRARLESGDVRRQFYLAALESFEAAVGLSPLVLQYQRQLARALEDLAATEGIFTGGERAEFRARAETIRTGLD